MKPAKEARACLDVAAGHEARVEAADLDEDVAPESHIGAVNETGRDVAARRDQGGDVLKLKRDRVIHRIEQRQPAAAIAARHPGSCEARFLAATTIETRIQTIDRRMTGRDRQRRLLVSGYVPRQGS
ncbi:MAG TPA: hypothetical protein VGM07_02185 [Stellaceae bacterium]